MTREIDFIRGAAERIRNGRTGRETSVYLWQVSPRVYAVAGGYLPGEQRLSPIGYTTLRKARAAAARRRAGKDLDG